MSNKTTMLGAYSPYTSEISDEAQTAFNEALKDLLGVKYKLVAVSQQVVAGMNYHFFCNTESVTRFPVNGAAIVSVYNPLKENAHITNIREIN
jgi:hypothetical protein